jgi:hypothetical protein
VSRLRVAALAAATAAILSTAQAAPAAALDVKLPLVPGQGDTGGFGARVETPAADVDVQVSARHVSAAVTTPDPSIEIPLPAPQKSPPEPSAPNASKGAVRGHKVDRGRTSREQQQVRPLTSERPAKPQGPSARMPAAPEGTGALPPRSFLPEAALSADEAVAATAAAPPGATPALAGLVLVAVSFLSWIAFQRPRKLSPPLLSFALQRPG